MLRLAFCLLLLSGGAALAQNQTPVYQSGSMTPGHAAKFLTNGIIGDAGPAGGGAPGVGLTELGITNTGTPFCINDASIVPNSGYHQLCLGALSLGGGLLSYNPYGTATPLPFDCLINGVFIANCLSGGGGGGGTNITATTPIVVTPSPLTTAGVISHADSGVTPGSYTNTNLTVDEWGHITAAADGSSGGGGTVTSVGLSVPAASLFGVTGSPVTTTGTLGVTTTGTSGGIPYFSSTSQLNSSGLLAAHSAVIGGGAGAAPTAIAGCTGGVLAWSTSGSDPSCTATPILGASGTVGSVGMGNNTSGTVTLSPVSGAALGTVTALLPANSGIIAELNLPQSWTAAQRGTPVNVAISTATFTPNFDTGQNFEIDLTSACPCTLANPSTSLVAGQSGVIEIHQDGSGSRTIGTWGTDYLYSGGTSTITLSTAASSIDYLSYYVNAAGTGIVLGAIVASPTH